ncbi:MAG: hypothetical protein ACR2QJ_14095 [Geminicoccaceae bacterium]
MTPKNGHPTDQHNRRRNSELIFSAALLVRRVDHTDLEVVLELEHIARRLDVLGKAILSDDQAKPEARDIGKPDDEPIAS